MTLLNLTDKITLDQTKWISKIHVADLGLLGLKFDNADDMDDKK